MKIARLTPKAEEFYQTLTPRWFWIWLWTIFSKKFRNLISRLSDTIGLKILLKVLTIITEGLEHSCVFDMFVFWSLLFCNSVSFLCCSGGYFIHVCSFPDFNKIIRCFDIKKKKQPCYNDWKQHNSDRLDKILLIRVSPSFTTLISSPSYL